MNQARPKGGEISICEMNGGKKQTNRKQGETVSVCTFLRSLCGIWGSRAPRRDPGWELGARWPPLYSRAVTSELGGDTTLSSTKGKNKTRHPQTPFAWCILEFQRQGGWRSAWFKPETPPSCAVPRQPFGGGGWYFSSCLAVVHTPIRAGAVSCEISC